MRGYQHLPLLRLIGIVLLICALARPQKGNENTKVVTEGISIMMLIDVSASMQKLDFSRRGKRQTRLDVVKEVFADFVEGKSGMQGRPFDLLGLISFGGYPKSNCPLTLDHKALLKILKERVQIPQVEYNSNGEVINTDEFQTAIGDALFIGIERLKKQPGKSKVMILLTDGENTAGLMDPLEAAEAAKKWEIKIYTIGVGNLGGYLLKRIAGTTKGEYFQAYDPEGLKSVYRAIDRMEKSEIQVSYLHYEELFAWFLLPGLFFIFLEKTLSLTVLRKIP